MKRVKIDKITHKFYQNDQERLAKIASLSAEMNEFMFVLGDLVSELHQGDTNLFIFDMNRRKFTIHAALVYCCGRLKNVPVNDSIRQHVTMKILDSKIYRKVVWEDVDSLS